MAAASVVATEAVESLVTQSEGSEQEIQCVVVPVADQSLLLPNVCIAEILPWRRIKAIPDAPTWFSGVLGWRGEMLPVVDFAMLCAEAGGDAEAATHRGRCLIVMNRSSASWGASFYAMIANGLPRLVAVAAEDLDGEANGNTLYEARRVQLGTEWTVIPDLAQIEQAVQTVGFGS
ncbi:MAG: chemotaxis protein CheW [Pseudomonadota bacterium]